MIQNICSRKFTETYEDADIREPFPFSEPLCVNLKTFISDFRHWYRNVTGLTSKTAIRTCTTRSVIHCWSSLCWNIFVRKTLFRCKHFYCAWCFMVDFSSPLWHQHNAIQVNLPVIVLDDITHSPDCSQVFIIAVRVDVMEGLRVPGIPVGAGEINSNLAHR